MKLLKEIVAKQDKALKIFACLIIALGITLRIAVYLQNRNLFIDEANLARNIYERGFLELLRPLSYEQYAPPVFLWILKICSLLFGFSEYALKIYPLLAGVGTLFVLYQILKEMTSFKSMWYPLFLLATTFMFVKFSTELKQHGCDMLVVLLLVLLTLKTDILNTRHRKFIILWCIVGSVAIWISMPSVFMLAGVGISYMFTAIRQKDAKKIISVVIVGAVWIVQFLFYYLAILKQQANSDYLQTTLSDYFIYLIPNGKEQLMHNWYLFRNILMMVNGGTFLAWFFAFLLFITASVCLLVKNTARALLLVLPIVFTFIAAGFHQYALLERYILFLTPLFIILFGYGFEVLLKIRFAAVKVVFIIAAVICAKNNNKIEMLYIPYRFEQLTDELNFLKKHNITGSQLYVHHGARPAFIYYTQIHPKKQQWDQFKGAHLLWWDVNYDSLARHVNGRIAFIYTSLSKEELIESRRRLENDLDLETFMEEDYGRRYVYIFRTH
jgi:4-amino-4-deoxy-L-arabinose transferase-like glycosyltransferase